MKTAGEYPVGPCGIDCSICELFTCEKGSKLYDSLIERGIPEHRIPCTGCRNVKGECPVIGGTCETYKCAGKHGVNYCYDCMEFPCAMLHPSADRAGMLPHNLKVYNLCVIRNKGVEEFLEMSAESKRRYFQGKMAVGKGPQV